MKIIISLLAFSCVLALTSAAVAGEGGDGHGGGHGNLDAKMNALFPPAEVDYNKNEAPDKPQLIEPSFHAQIKGDKATLKWKSVDAAEQYHVQVATDPNFKWLVANDNFVKETSYEVAGLEAGKNYFWRVASVKSDNAATHTHGLFSSSMFATSDK